MPSLLKKPERKPESNSTNDFGDMLVLSIDVNGTVYPFGAASFFKCFFSTIHCNLETDQEWGSKYPKFLTELYSGRLEKESGAEAMLELEDICRKLKTFPPSAVVWDHEDRTARPPWGDNISSHITDLANYFVTADGKDLIEALRHALKKMIDEKTDLIVV